jgi:hypothetical protein
MNKGLGVALSLGLLAASAGAQEVPWRAAGKAPAPAASAPAVTLGRPQAIEAGPVAGPVRPASYVEAGSVTASPVTRGQAGESPWVPASLPVLGAPQPVAPGMPVATVAHSNAPPPPDPYFAPPPPPPGNPIPPPQRTGPGLFGCEWLGCTTGSCRKIFESDHDFDGFISPVSNPFLFEDPRSLTELRPVFMYQLTPNSNPVFQGGNLWFFGTQARLAVTERLSIVMNKLGWTWIDPNDNPAGISPHVGLSELWAGPKLTFWRDDRTCTLAAVGATLQIPLGGGDVYQNTGSLTVAPYVTFAKAFLRDFHFMTVFGYAIGDNERSDYFWNSYHLDYDLGGLHRIYPLIELNWVHYTKSGDTQPINFEGRDLINFGARNISGADSLTLAFGVRYKIMGSECYQVGTVLEFPLIASPDLNNFRFTLDFIWRY